MNFSLQPVSALILREPEQELLDQRHKALIREAHPRHKRRCRFF